MPKRFLISIIGLNRLDATRACIEAVFRHSKNFDLVLINNASTDGTGDYFDQLARDYPNVTVLNRPTDFHRVFLFSGMRGGQRVAAARVVHNKA
jgi:glycosyltransferase involved in cell wall biosynthesis